MNNIMDNSLNINSGPKFSEHVIVKSGKHLRPDYLEKIPTRKVYKRNIALSVIYSIITFGIYGLFWLFEIAKETNAITKNNKCVTPALVVFLSIITLGIYQVYWAYQIGVKHNTFFEYNAQGKKSLHVIYLILSLLNYIFPILNLVCYAIMQSNINKMLIIYEHTNRKFLYVKDSSIFNRPIWSTILLILIAQNIPQIFVSIFENMFPNAAGNPYAINNNINNPTDLVKNIIQNSADQIIYADTPFMIVYSILSIVTVILVLWWFKLRFKHVSYTGVLVFKNLGRAFLVSLPVLLFAGLNVLGLNFANFKIGIVLLGFIPAFAEEITFRGMIIPNFMRIYNRPKGIWLSLFVSAAIFGGIHATNIFAGADVGTTIFQVSYATSLGFIFAGILIRYGNLWPCIILHGLIDTFAMMSDEALKQGAVQTQAFTFSWEILPIVILSLIFIFCGIWICRPKKHNEICALWKEKWGSAIC